MSTEERDQETITKEDVDTLTVGGGGELAVVKDSDALSGILAEAGAGKYADEQALAEVTKVGDWLPFIQLMGSNSKEVKEGKFPMGHFCLRRNRQMIDLGERFVGVFLDWRPKAMMFGPPPISVFDPKHEKFAEFEKQADTAGVQGYGYGQEFLVWLPDRRILVTYFMGNKTGRNESPNITAIINDAKFVCEQRSELIDDGKNQWHGARTYEHDLPFDFPPEELLRVELQKFKNPEPIVIPKSETEGEVETDSGEGDSRR